ncbi:Sec-independent protein translocase protein TatB [Kingella negevensis]|uniref:Sec-independent protein translocase protein TatB n=1 Tax=Kingella negevensis TaxID=1522312 RepID=UPI002543A0F8|nr:Sec-independent protein translocase protein TatB [Kingella negevensis]MDK4680260.1 Sec-independent protein translocase protein TatB [Kingella negevensis]MDK4682020.1 Sec-independent protein translocase protein TatB [Kingella negevensis]MDK4690216.1 Sec-independent protein translocase protein TatB [Kingella negevensis]MDK4692439.1 Sec-independent protein translocase protein TatB [Kingella negevensis]MDK4698740.1 Sec-independent protein translocase protein TatB [Kingella negevensis]
MFDLSFGEMMVAGAVALVVLGPERLPVVARKTGEWVGKIQRMAANVKSELAAQAEAVNLNQVKAELEQAATDIQQDLRSFANQVENEAREVAEQSKPAWERLPEQKTPADFGIETDDQGFPIIPVSGSLKNAEPVWQTKSLRKQAMTRKRDMRPRHRVAPKLRSKK